MVIFHVYVSHNQMVIKLPLQPASRDALATNFQEAEEEVRTDDEELAAWIVFQRKGLAKSRKYWRRHSCVHVFIAMI